MLVRSSIFNKGRKSFGNTTAVQWVDNQQIIKSKISDPTNPNTPRQQLRRGIFASLQRFGGTLLPFLHENFASTAANRSPYSSFMRAALLAYQGATEYDPQNFDDVEPVQFTNGPLQPLLYGLDDITIEVGSTSGPFVQLDITFNFSPDHWWPNADYNDEIFMFVCNPDGNFYNVSASLGTRDAGSVNHMMMVLTNQRSFIGIFARNSENEISLQSALMIGDDDGNWNPGITVV